MQKQIVRKIMGGREGGRERELECVEKKGTDSHVCIDNQIIHFN